MSDENDDFVSMVCLGCGTIENVDIRIGYCADCEGDFDENVFECD